MTQVTATDQATALDDETNSTADETEPDHEMECEIEPVRENLAITVGEVK